MGILGWRDKDDEKLIQAISDACLSDPGEEMKNSGREEESYSLKSDLESDLPIFCGKDIKICILTKKKLLITSFSCCCLGRDSKIK